MEKKGRKFEMSEYECLEEGVGEPSLCSCSMACAAAGWVEVQGRR